jgi:hypothetical protein
VLTRPAAAQVRLVKGKHRSGCHEKLSMLQCLPWAAVMPYYSPTFEGFVLQSILEEDRNLTKLTAAQVRREPGLCRCSRAPLTPWSGMVLQPCLEGHRSAAMPEGGL